MRLMGLMRFLGTDEVPWGIMRFLLQVFPKYQNTWSELPILSMLFHTDTGLESTPIRIPKPKVIPKTKYP